MRPKFYLPEQVVEKIQAHINEKLQQALETSDSAAEEEDSLTAHIFSKLQSKKQKVTVNQSRTEEPGTWKWSIDYYKFRGRGKAATEKSLGADGIIELTVHRGGGKKTKSLLFQSKFEGSGGKKLVEQCVKLSTWREAAFVLQFGNNGFTTISIDDAIRLGGNTRLVDRVGLSNFLGQEFLNCNIGDMDLRYRAREKKLVWRSQNDEIVGVRFPTRHRLRFNVEPPTYGFESHPVDRQIKPEDIHKHRMRVDPEDLLPVDNNNSSELKKVQRRLAKIYHPDSAHSLSDETQDLLRCRMQEINAAYDTLKR